MAVLSKFLADLHSHIQLKQAGNEIQDIKNGVETIIRQIMDKIGTIDPNYRTSKILNVGEFYEGTKICQPDEFDFLVQLEELAEDGHVIVEKYCEENAGSVHARLKPSEYRKWGGEGMSESCWLSPQHLRFHLGEHTRRAVAEIVDSKNNEITTNSGNLQLIYETRPRYPNFAVFMKWTPFIGKELIIGADITFYVPVDRQFMIEIPGINPEISKLLAKNKDIPSIIVPPSRGNMFQCTCGQGLFRNACWRVSFTPFELVQVRQLSDIHKMCYRILKYIFKVDYREDEFSSYSLKIISSYVLKNAILLHSTSCSEQSSDLAPCLQSIFDFFIECSDKKFLPHYYLPNKNTWSSDIKRELIVPEKIIALAHNLLFETILNIREENYDFNRTLSLLHNVQRRFYKIEMKLMTDYQNRDTKEKKEETGEMLCLPTGESNTTVIYQRTPSEDNL